jgi:RNA polymerase primary sigma factor
MLQTLSLRCPPLEQIRRHTHVPLADPARQLSLPDQATLQQILTGKCDYVPNALFEKPGAETKIFAQAPPIGRRNSSWYHPMMESLGAPRTTHGGNAALLTRAQESALFLQFNYCRYKVAQLRGRIGDDPVVPADAAQALAWHRKAEDYRDQIAQTNLALVLAMAKRTRAPDGDFPDLVSEGNMALLRATDKFDVALGFKFSTYACRAILQTFSRTAGKLSRYRQSFPTGLDPLLQRSDFMDKKREAHLNDCVDEIRQIIRENRADLNRVEREVIQRRFGVGPRIDDHPDGTPLTLEQVGKIIGVTKERVRQIQRKALDQIRLTLEAGFLR